MGVAHPVTCRPAPEMPTESHRAGQPALGQGGPPDPGAAEGSAGGQLLSAAAERI